MGKIFTSLICFRNTDLKTYVPPHPKDDTRMWSSLKAIQYGADQYATAYETLGSGEMKKYLQYCVDNGFVLYRDRQ